MNTAATGTVRLTNSMLSAFLRSRSVNGAGLIDKLKIGYRPFICPFVDLLDLLPAGASVFDIGCGNGMFLSLVAKFKKPAALGGVEISDRLIANAIQVCCDVDPNIPLHLSVGTALDIPQSLAKFDHVFLIDVLHHIPKAKQWGALAHIHDRMSPGATFVLKDIDATRRMLTRCNKLHDLLLAGEIGHERKAGTIARHLQRIGFKIRSATSRRMLAYPHCTFVCEK